MKNHVIKECKFCGAPHTGVYIKLKEDDGIMCAYVFCKHCNARGPRVKLFLADRSNKSVANVRTNAIALVVRRWNGDDKAYRFDINENKKGINNVLIEF